jgi:hypothetical protein
MPWLELGLGKDHAETTAQATPTPAAGTGCQGRQHGPDQAQSMLEQHNEPSGQQYGLPGGR